MASRIRWTFAFRSFSATLAGGSPVRWLVLLAVLLLGLPGLQGVSSAQPIYQFEGQDGAGPLGELVQGRDGYLYGWTPAGGAFDKGTLFRVAPDGTGFQTLHSFEVIPGNADGAEPLRGALVEGATGVFYGISRAGGLFGLGALFKLAVTGPAPVVTILYSFSDAEAQPDGGVIIGSDGALYGTTSGGGSVNSFGTVFRVGLDGQGFTVLHAFSGAGTYGEGIRPLATVIEASIGWLYGTTSERPGVEAGTVFRMLKDGSAFQTIAAFLPGVSEAALIEVPGPSGPGLCGVTRAGTVPPSYGSIFRVALDGTAFESLWDFPLAQQPMSYSPMGRLLLGRDGNLYGTTSLPDDPNCPSVGCGSIFRLKAGAPTAAGYTCEWTLPTGLAALAPGASSETLTLLFDVGPAPFAPDCGLGPSPCVAVTAALIDQGGAAAVTSTVRTQHPTTGQWNQPPQAVDDLAHVDGANGTTIAVLANDTDPDGDPLSVTGIVVQPVFGTATINTDGTVSYSPFTTLTEPDTFRYRVADNQGASVVGLVRVFPLPGQPGLGRARIDLGVVAVGRLAAGRITVSDTAGLGGTVTFQQMTSPSEILDALAGTGYDPSRAASDPGDFRSAGWSSQLPPADPEALLYFRPSSTDVGRVSVVRAVFEFTGTVGTAQASLVIVGSSADPAAAPPRAADDVASTPPGTPVEIDVSANDQGPSGGPVFPAFIAPACATSSRRSSTARRASRPLGGTASLVLRDSGSGLRPAAVAFTPQDAFVGAQRFYYGSSDVSPCGGALPCDFADNLYFAAVDVAVNGPGDDSVRGTIGGVVRIRYDILLANDAPGLSFAGLVGSTFGPTHFVQDLPGEGLLRFNHFGSTSAETISFTYEAVDSAGRRYPAAVRVVVDNRVPTAVDQVLQVIPGQTLEVLWESIVSAPGNVDPDGDPITLAAYELIDASPFGVFEGFGTALGLGGFRFTPAPTYTGGYAFRYDLRDLADLRGADYDGHGSIGYGTLTFPIAAAAPLVRVEAALSWTRVVGPGPLAVGDVVRLTGRVANSSSGTAHSPAARFVLPADMGTTGFTAPGWVSPWTCSPSPALTNGSAGTPGVVVTCTGPDLAPGDAREIVVFARILAAPAGGALEPAFAAGNSDCDATQAAGIPVCSSVTTSMAVTPDATARIGVAGGAEVLMSTSAGQFRAAQGQPLEVFHGTPLPPGVSLSYGVMSFETTGLPVGGTAVVTLQTPSPVAGYWKYQGNAWTAFPGAVPVPRVRCGEAVGEHAGSGDEFHDHRSPDRIAG